MTLRRVANLGLDGSTVTVTFGKIQVPAITASYADKLEKGKLSPMGSQEITEITPGSYSTEDWKIKVSAVTFRTLIMPAMPKTGGGNVRMQIVVGRTHPDLGDDSDMLDGCYIGNIPAALENSNKAEEVELSGTVRQIFWTDERKTINQLASELVQQEGGF